MKLTVFFAGTGEALLLSSSESKNVLIDGGPSDGNFDRHILPSLQRLHTDAQQLDLVIVTHIDDDHIVGILRLLHLYEQASQRRPRADVDDLPTIAAVWHNSWSEVSPGILSTRARGDAPGAALRPPWSGFERGLGHVCYSPAHGSEVVVITDTELRSIKRNRGFRGGLVALDAPPRMHRLGTALTLTVLGPGRHALDDLKAVFERDEAARASSPTLRKRVLAGLRSARARLNLSRPMRKRMLTRRNVQQIAGQLSEDTDILRRAETAPQVPAPDLAAPVLGHLGDATKVTPANRASIIVLAADAGGGGDGERTCLLTGDAAAPDIVEGLTAAGRLQEGGMFRCDILKVQHHGAEFNFDETFARRVIAQHYVLSANGQYSNPDPEVMSTLIGARASVSTEPFCIWFTCSAERAPVNHQSAMQAALDAAVAAARKVNSHSRGQATIRVLKDSQSFFDICLCSATAGTCGCIPADDATIVLVS